MTLKGTSGRAFLAGLVLAAALAAAPGWAQGQGGRDAQLRRLHQSIDNDRRHSAAVHSSLSNDARHIRLLERAKGPRAAAECGNGGTTRPATWPNTASGTTTRSVT